METQNQDKRSLKILVIGSKGHPREVQSYNWTEIDRAPNIADQDAVIIDMTSLTKSVLEEIIASESVGYFKSNYFLKLFASRGQVFVIAVPTAEVEDTSYDNYWWNPFTLEFEREKGDTVEKVNDKFQRYFNNVKSWNFTMDFDKSAGIVKDIISSFSNEVIHKLAQTRYRAPIGIQLVPPAGARFCFLPPPTEISTKTAIDIILEDFFGIKISEMLEPDWVREIKVPDENKTKGRIKKSLDRIRIEKKEIEKSKQEMQSITKFRKLLYTEDEELEQIVWTTFRELGAKVIEPKEKNKEDGWIETKFGKAVLEIKKAAKSASRVHTRQLDNWVGNCIANGEKCKGVLIINHFGDKPLKERKEAFPSDVRDHAKKARPASPFCLLTTVELFKAFCAFKEGKVSSDEIFKKIFEADGEECKLI